MQHIEQSDIRLEIVSTIVPGLSQESDQPHGSEGTNGDEPLNEVDAAAIADRSLPDATIIDSDPIRNTNPAAGLVAAPGPDSTPRISSHASSQPSSHPSPRLSRRESAPITASSEEHKLQLSGHMVDTHAPDGMHLPLEDTVSSRHSSIHAVPAGPLAEASGPAAITYIASRGHSRSGSGVVSNGNGEVPAGPEHGSGSGTAIAPDVALKYAEKVAALSMALRATEEVRLPLCCCPHSPV